MRIRVLTALIVVLWAADSVGHVDLTLIILVALAVAVRVARRLQRPRSTPGVPDGFRGINIVDPGPDVDPPPPGGLPPR